VGLATGRWTGAVGQWIEMASESRIVMSHDENKDIWKSRLKKLEDLVVFGLIETKVTDFLS
jgi:hypothetical protein